MTDEKTLIRIKSVLNQLSILCDFVDVDAQYEEFPRANAYNEGLATVYKDLEMAYKELKGEQNESK
ncbi:hypothetical protein [Methanorbis furvi]|uniref:Uncharacterized protein n=1 Tax=Methanorbis furvi TaxID=3028299 RepID=A0AAE4ME79_9EURY|nr:hypothetical protein [Methanocorpusculaceae archaeon Ag1]